MWKALAALAALLAAGVWALSGLGDFELSGYETTELGFSLGDTRLSGTLVLPAEGAPVAVLVHGDGAQDRWSDGGYLPLVNALLDRGIGVYSYDKPGVGASAGHWLAQSMDDRAAEAAAAFAALRAADRVTGPVGFLGFSQAGWAVPQAGEAAAADFVVLMGPAVSWRRQGVFYARRRFEAEGHAPAEALRLAEAELAEDDAAAATRGPVVCAPETCTRADFLARNREADATAAIARITRPVLVMVGAADLNVDAQDSAATYRATLSPDTPARVVVVPNATHSLLRARWFNHQTPADWPLWSEALFAAMGRRAYAPGVLDRTAGFILNPARAR